MCQEENRKGPPSDDRESLRNMHDLLLQALRHREQEIFQYLTILGPALGGFAWLYVGNFSTGVFTAGTVGVLLVLFLGALYSLVLGYNYRYLVLQLAKLEAALGIRDIMIVNWPRSSQDFLDHYRLRRRMAFCIPPEIIKVFWWAFLMGLFAITAKAWEHQPGIADSWPILVVGVMSLVLGGLLFPMCLARKLRRTCEKEPPMWDNLAVGGVSPEVGGQEQ